ncbi:DUF2066 domain-containing protein [Marinobacter sp. CHS3-4]|uniref:DUF2066 domain-containing protein n=1 Tax=Marinobacter sp. CHS3-4 TaxID=3045174 RepID=UPI0024B4C68D|nr:DUF2066 domain-containing protein [Marinobacter sp. CHS3-4]MDI9246853.1 DUF2066 domain-containing protein [Marinobacter sp. CHS3-4]
MSGRVGALMALLTLFSLPISAATVTGLYAVDVPVESSSPDDLAQGYSDGLKRVMVRVSGTQDVLALEGVSELLENAESLLQSYQYLRSEENGNQLQMVFGAVGVNKALASIGAPVWGANRPLTLAWIAVESGGTRQLLHQSADTGVSGPWLKAFRKAAEDRGLPVTLPPEEYADRRELMSDIWGQFTSNVRTASEDMAYDLMSLVRVSRSTGQWRAGWVFDGMGLDSAEQSLTAATPEELAAAVVGRWADTFAERYAVESSDVGESPQVDIVLHGIRELEDYATANRVLKNLSPVVSASATATRNGRVTMNITFSGEIEQLKRYIALDPRLVPLSNAEVSQLPAQDTESKAEVDTDTDTDTDTQQARGLVSMPGKDAQTSAPSNPFVTYESLFVEQNDAEKAFDSLYQVLHYRWQPASVIEGETGE